MSDSMNGACNRVEAIPDDLKNVLSKFALEYLTLRPSNVIEFGLQFFSNMQKQPVEMPMSTANSELRLSMSHFSDSSVSENVSEVDKYYKSDMQSANLYAALLDTDYFRNHNDNDIFNAINQMYCVSIEAGSTVELKNDSTLYVIDDGILNIGAGESNEKIDETFGCFSLMQLKWKYGQKDLCINSEIDTTLWVLDSTIFQRCWIGDVHAKCRDYETILEFSPIFSGLVDVERQMLADLMVTKRYQAGDMIYDGKNAENEAAGCYFIQDGMVSLAMNDSDRGIQTVLLKSGQHFGEITSKDEMILKTAEATSQVRCAHLSGNVITDLIKHPFTNIRPNLCSRCKSEF